MWKQFYEWVEHLFLLSRDTRRNRVDIREIREVLHRLTRSVQELEIETSHIRQQVEYIRALDASEREKMVLRLENEMLRLERRLLADDRYKGRADESSTGGFEAS